MLYDLVNECSGDQAKKKDLLERFNRLTKICNIFLESTVKVSISTTLDDIFEFFKKYYAVLPFYGLASSRILSLCEEYVLL